MKYKVQPGDSLIKICRKFNLNSIDDLLLLNPQIKDPNKIIDDTWINLPESVDSDYGGTIAAATATAEKGSGSTDYFKMTPSEQAYAEKLYAAYKSNQITWDQIPSQYQPSIFKMKVGDNKAVASALINYMNPYMYADRFLRGTASVALHPDDYSFSDVWGPYADYSVTGRDFRDAHPYVAGATDLIASYLLGSGASTFLRNGIPSWSTLISRGTTAADLAGIPRIDLKPAETPIPGRVSGTRFQGSTTAKGFGKTGTATKGAGNSGYSANASAKSAYHNEYHGTGGAKKVKAVSKTAGEVVPETAGEVAPGYVVTPVPAPATTPVAVRYVQAPEEHIETTRVFNPWIYTTNYDVPTIPYAYGEEDPEYETGEAPRGQEKEDQPIKGAERKKGSARAKAEIKSGAAKEGKESGFYSVYGINGGTDINWYR